MKSLEVFDSDHGIMKMKRELLKSLREHYKHMESNEYYAIAILDLLNKKYFYHHLQ